MLRDPFCNNARAEGDLSKKSQDLVEKGISPVSAKERLSGEHDKEPDFREPGGRLSLLRRIVWSDRQIMLSSNI